MSGSRRVNLRLNSTVGATPGWGAPHGVLPSQRVGGTTGLAVEAGWAVIAARAQHSAKEQGDGSALSIFASVRH